MEEPVPMTPMGVMQVFGALSAKTRYSAIMRCTIHTVFCQEIMTEWRSILISIVKM